jgi:hypothetical protein
MKKGKEYSYKQIEDFAVENDFSIFDDIGGATIGRNFIVLEHNVEDKTVSFVLTGAGQPSTGGYIYECVYSDLK